VAPEQRPWQAAPDGLVLAVRLTPRGGRDALEGVELLSDGRAVLKARVRAVPEDGKANAALAKLLAGTCGTSVSRVSLSGGATSRVKTWRIEGDATTLVAALERHLAGLAPGRNQ
jgi:uncharacterized protein YggU (UPF0235/DUF167 family)